MNTIKFESANTKVIAHRGLSGLERENTNAAFVAACNRSYFGVETDVHVTKDGKFVIIHDTTTDRVSLGQQQINVEENEFSAVEDIILPDLDGSTCRRDLKIPSLKEYIHICKKYGKICVLEAKNHFAERDLENMIEEIKTEGYIEKVIFISFDLENCVNARKFLPENDVQWLLNAEVTDEVVKILCDNKLNLDISYKKLKAEDVELLHSKGITVNCWTCDDKEIAEKLVGMGVDFITTNILE